MASISKIHHVVFDTIDGFSPQNVKNDNNDTVKFQKYGYTQIYIRAIQRHRYKAHLPELQSKAVFFPIH